MRKPLLLAIVVLAGVAAGPSMALAYDDSAAAAPAVRPGDRAFYNVGRVCVAQMNGLVEAVGAAMRGGSSTAFLNTARTLQSRARVCARKVKARSAATSSGKRARAKLAKAMKQYAKAGADYRRAANATKAGSSATSSALVARAGQRLRKAERLLLKSDRLARAR